MAFARWRPFRAAAGVLFVAAAARGADPEATRVDLPVPAFDAAFDPGTGGLAVVVPDQDRVVLYPRFAATGGKAEPVSAKVGRLPVAVAFKPVGDRAYFLVACRDAAEVAVLDAVTLKLVKAIPLGGVGPVAVSASPDPKDRFAYYTGAVRRGGRPALVTGRLDLATLSDAGKAPGLLAVQAEYVPSADGALIHYRHRVQLTAQPHVHTRRLAGGVGEKADPDFPPGTADGPGLLADPFGEYVVGGVVACDLRTGKELGRLPFRPLAASAARPFLFGVKDDRLAVASANSFKVVGAAPLPAKKDELLPGPELAAPDRLIDVPLVLRTRVFEDRAAKAVLVAHGRVVFVVPDAALDLPDEPLLVLRPEGPPDFVVGRRGGLRVQPAGAARGEITTGPAGMALADGVLTWAPGPDAVGAHEVVVRLTAGPVTKVVKLTAVVRRDGVELPFTPSGPVPLSADGTAAVVAGWTRDPADTGPVVHRVAVVDLAAGKVTAVGVLPSAPTSLAADGSYVYAALPGSGQLAVLSRKDLAEVRRVNPGHPVERVTAVGGRYVAATGDRRTTVLSVPLLVPATLAGHATTIRPYLPGGGPDRQAADRAWDGLPPVWAGDGWWYRGVLYDAALEKPRAALDPRDFWQPEPTAGPHPSPAMSDDPPGYRYAAATPDGRGGYVSGDEARWYGPWGATAAGVPLPDHPATAARYADPPRAGGPDVSATGVGFADTSGKPLARVPLVAYRGSAPGGSLAVRPGGFVALVGRHLYAEPLPEAVAAAKGPVPLRVVPDYPFPVAGPGETVLPLPAVAGAGGPVGWAVGRGPEGLRYDAAAGRLVLSPGRLVARLSREVGSRVGTDPEYQRGTPSAVLTDYLRRTAGAFERLTGRKPAGVPVWVPFDLAATDRGRRAEGRFGFFVDLPAAGVLAWADAVAAGADAPPGQVAELLRERARLEARVAELEKKTDALTRKLDDLLKALDPGPGG